MEFCLLKLFRDRIIKNNQIVIGNLKFGNGDVDTVQGYGLFKRGKNGINQLSIG